MKKMITVLSLAILSGTVAVNARTTGEMRRDHFERVARVQNLARALMNRVENEAFSMRPDMLASVESSLYGVQDSLNGRRPTRPTRPTREYSCNENPNVSMQVLAERKMLNLASDTLGYNYSDARTFLSNWSQDFKCESADLYIENAKKLASVAGSYLQLNYSDSLSYVRENSVKLCQSYDLIEQAKGFVWLAENRGLNYSDKGRFVRARLIKDGAYDCVIDTVK